MKKLFALMLALCLILGLSATAWAGDRIDVTNKPSGTLGRNQNVTVNISIIPNNKTVEGATVTATITDFKTSTGSLSGNATTGYTLTFNTKDLPSNNKITLTLSEKVEITYDDDRETTIDNYTYPEVVDFDIAPQPPSLNSNNITISCGHGTFSPTGNGPFSFVIPGICFAAGSSHNLTISVTGITNPSDYDITFSPDNSIPIGLSSGTRTITVSNKPTASGSTKDSSTATINISQSSSTDTSIGVVTLSGGATVSTSNGSGSTLSNPTTIEVPNTASGAINIAATAGAVGAFASPSRTTSNASDIPFDFTVTVTAPNGITTQTYYYRVTRATAAVPLATAVDIRSGTSPTSTLVVDSTTAITSTSATQTMTIPNNTTNNNLSTFYAHITLASGATLTSATFGSDNATITSGNIVTLPLPTNTSSRNLVLNFSAGGNNHTKTITVNRAAAAVSLATAVNIRTSTSPSGTVVVGSTTTITSTSASQTMAIPNSTSNNSTSTFYAHITLVSGVTLSSATFNGTATITNGNVVTLQLPTTVTERDLVLRFTVNGNNYDKTITVTRGSSGTTLSNLYIKSSASGANSNNSFTTSPSSFSSSTRTYTVYVNDNTDYIYIYPIKNNSSDNVSASGTYNSMTSSSGYFTVRLNSSGTNRVYIDVNGSSNRYTLNIEREQSIVQNASLSSLIVNNSSTSSSSGTRYSLSPAFAFDRTRYDVSIPRSVSEVYLYYSKNTSSASVTITGATYVREGVYRAALTADKTKEVKITVSYSGNSTIYYINLNSGNSSSKSARLSSLRVASQESISSSSQFTLAPAFSSSVEEYVALIPNDKISNDTVYVQATLDNTSDTLSIDGATISSGSWKDISIDTGSRSKRSTSVPIRVRESSSVSTEYKLTLLYGPSGGNNDTALSSLSIRTGSSTSTNIPFNRSFSSSTYSYTADGVDNNTQSVRVYCDPSDSAAWVLVNDVLMENNDYVSVDLSEGSNSIKVLVYAEDCKANRTYTISINRGSGGSSDSTLSGLEARYGAASNQVLNLIPGFDRSIYTYSINVDSTINQIAFRRTASDSGATIRFTNYTTISNGQWTSYNTLTADSTVYSFQVTSADGRNSSTYTISVTRGLRPVVSPQSLTVNGTPVTCAAYNINGNNYFKLRDIAFALRGTPKRFDVTYNDATRLIIMTSGRDYTAIGGEMIRPTTSPIKCILSNQSVQLDGRPIYLTAYNADGNNYFMLREIGALFDFAVDFVNGNTVQVNTSRGYTPDVQ